MAVRLLPVARRPVTQIPHDGPNRGPVGQHTTPLQDHPDLPVSVGAIGALKDVLNQDGQILPPDGCL